MQYRQYSICLGAPGLFGASAVKPMETMLFRDINFRSFLTLFYQKWDPRGINRGPAVSENKHKMPTPKHHKKHLKTQVRSNCRNIVLP